MSIRKRAGRNETSPARRTVAIIGCGAGGEAHALHLRESGTTVVVGLTEEGRPWEKAAAEGFAVYPLDEAFGGALEGRPEKPGKGRAS